MTQEGFKRKLSAILSADVKGYSRLMDDNEEATVMTLTAYRSAMSDLVQQFRGRVVDATGDNLMAEFTSVVDAVNCAVEIQRELAERNARLEYKRKMEFRIGVNLGDVIEEEGGLYGDGVNIAARVEGLAEAGGICISGRAYDQVANKLGLEYENLGEHEVKNISVPIRVYRVLSYPGAAAHRVVKAKSALKRKWRNISLTIAAVIVLGAVVGILNSFIPSATPPQETTSTEKIEVASVEKMAYPLPDKPSIAVLPFENLGGDSEQEYLADGISENITSMLSKINKMFVIARTSTIQYKNKPVKVQKIAEDLSVRYILEGSVIKSKDKLRVTAQLIDALTGHHLWSEQYDHDLKDLFDLLDEITLEIIAALQIKLISGEEARLFKKDTSDIRVWEYLNRAFIHQDKGSKHDYLQARELFQKAIVLDPNSVRALAGLSNTYSMEAMFGWAENHREARTRALRLARQAVKLNDSHPSGYSALVFAYSLRGQFYKAINVAEKALDLNPNSSICHMWLGIAKRFTWETKEAISLMLKAMRLSPYYPPWYLEQLAECYHQAGDYEVALRTYKHFLERCKDCGEEMIREGTYGVILTNLELFEEDEARKILSTLNKSDIINLWSYNPALYKDFEKRWQVLSPLFDLYQSALEKKVYVHKGMPVFKFEYPASSKKWKPMVKRTQVFALEWRRSPVAAYIDPAPEGFTLEKGFQIYFVWFSENLGSEHKIISNEPFKLKDGTPGQRLQFKWLWTSNRTWITTIAVGARTGDKFVYLATHTWKAPQEVAWIVESLTFK